MYENSCFKSTFHGISELITYCYGKLMFLWWSRSFVKSKCTCTSVPGPAPRFLLSSWVYLSASISISGMTTTAVAATAFSNQTIARESASCATSFYEEPLGSDPVCCVSFQSEQARVRTTGKIITSVKVC